MISLITSEWERVRWFAFFAIVVHAVVLAILANYGLLFANNLGLNVALTSMYGCAAAFFGVQQMRNYSQGGSWVFLINRPMRPSLIAISLSISASMFFFVLIVPWMIATLSLAAFSTKVIEFRHFLLLPYLHGIATSFYLAGATISLSRRALVGALLWLPLLSIISLHVGGNVLALLAAIAGLMLVLVLFFFKPAIGSRPQGVRQVCLIAAAIQLSCFLAFTAITQTARQIIEQNFAMETRPDVNSDQLAFRVATSYQQTVRLDGQAKIVAGLSGLPENQFETISRTVRASEVYQIKKAVSFLPLRQQIPFVFDRGLTLVDDDHEVVWEFSHSAMQFIGHRQGTRKYVGRMGPDGTATPEEEPLNAGRFSFVPWIAGMQLACGRNLYRYNGKNQTIELQFELAEGQSFQSPLMPKGSLYSILSERELYLFDGIEIKKDVFPICAMARIELPDDYNNLRDVSLVELRDDYLVSFLSGKDERVRAYGAAQITYRVSRDGNVTLLNRRELERALTKSAPWVILSAAIQYCHCFQRIQICLRRAWPQQLPRI